MKPSSALRRAAERRGRWAESLCALRLTLTGWRILARRQTGLRGTGIGEIDLIARRGKVVAFIEVKARAERELGVLAVGEAQQRRIVRAAEIFLARRPDLADCEVRFDVMIVSGIFPHRLTDAWRP